MRVVVKVGSSTLTYPSTGLLNIPRIESLCKVLSDIKNEGHEIIFVSSGAIAMGLGKLGLNENQILFARNKPLLRLDKVN